MRQKVLSDFSKKFLRREISFRGTPGEGPSLCMPLCGMQIHSSCVLRMQVGAPPRHPASLREGLTQALFLVTHQNLKSTSHGNARPYISFSSRPVQFLAPRGTKGKAKHKQKIPKEGIFCLPAGPCYPTEETLPSQGGVLFAPLCYQRPLILRSFSAETTGSGRGGRSAFPKAKLLYFGLRF